MQSSEQCYVLGHTILISWITEKTSYFDDISQRVWIWLQEEVIDFGGDLILLWIHNNYFGFYMIQ